MAKTKRVSEIPDPLGSASDDRAVRAKVTAIALHEAYGSPRHGNKEDPLDELIFIILSQMTTHHSFGRVFDRMKHVFPNWDEIRRLPIQQLAEVIKDAGLSNQKAPRIKTILERLYTDFGRVSLDHLYDLSDDEAEHYLTSLPGVGTKTAKCVLMYSLGRKVLPVDTHVWRLVKRLGLIPFDLPFAKVHQELEAVVRPEDRYSLHVNALTHGRTICLAKTPRCISCPISLICPASGVAPALDGT